MDRVNLGFADVGTVGGFDLVTVVLVFLNEFGSLADETGNVVGNRVTSACLNKFSFSSTDFNKALFFGV